MIRRQRVTVPDNHERWLVSYADFVTLLFGFFVVMYSVSQMNEVSYQELSDTLSELFLDVEKLSTPSNISAADNIHENPEVLLAEKLSELVDEKAFSISRNEQWLEIMLNNQILFESGSTTPSMQAEAIIGDISEILLANNNPVQVEGFTDNIAIQTTQYPSNWELSSARAIAMVKLFTQQGISPKRLSAVGYGEFQPIATNETEQGRALNRRIVIRVGDTPRVFPQVETVTNPKEEIQSITSEGTTGDSSNNGSPVSIEPVILDNGELLFSSDPDLPRK